MIQRKMRQSQTLSPFGVGGILDLQGESLVACDIYRWGMNRGERIQSERLQSLLRVRALFAAPTVESKGWNSPARGIPYARFPAWLFCNSCRRMVQWRRSMEQEDQRPECPVCHGHRALAPMRWIQICPQGHMDDVDWWWWAHQGTAKAEQRQCQVRDRLEFQTAHGRSGGGLDTLVIYCRACSASKNLMGLTSSGVGGRLGFKCKGRQPWQPRDRAVECDEEVKVVQRGASNVYFPTVHSSIEIPTTSSSDAFTEQSLAIVNDNLFVAALEADGLVLEFIVEQLASNHAVDDSFVRSVIAAHREGVGDNDGAGSHASDLLGEEWAAFLTPTDDPDHADFVTRHVGLTDEGAGTGDVDDATATLSELLGKVVVADRLREVRVLQGFHRVTPAPGTQVPVDLGHGLDWLPAIEVRGEGIFLSLDEARLEAWESNPTVAARAVQMDERLERSFQRDWLRHRTGVVVRPRFLLLHTLAHLLMRRLAFETGYSASSLRERIYARSGGDEAADLTPQAGILIYTAAGDSEGTLGGLVRQGEPPTFARTLIEAVNDGAWCSSDPLCLESEATSFDSLNLAACHACALVSETSCEVGNFLLDRVMVIGNEETPGFFQSVHQAALTAAAEAAR